MITIFKISDNKKRKKLDIFECHNNACTKEKFIDN